MSGNQKKARIRKQRPPMPAEGGSYLRQADGSLSPQTPPAATPAPAADGRKRAVKEA